MAEVLVLGLAGASAFDSWLSASLAAELVRAKHDVEFREISFPFSGSARERLAALVDLERTAPVVNFDGPVIATSFPAYIIQHPQKTIWLSSQYEPHAELWKTGLCNLADCPKEEAFRRAIFRTEYREFSLGKLFTCTNAKKNWLKATFGVSSEVLYPPLLDGVRAESLQVTKNTTYSETDSYILCIPSSSFERVCVVLAALKVVHRFVRLVVAALPGVVDSRELERTAADLGVADRVDILKLESEGSLNELISGAMVLVDAAYLSTYPRFSLQAMARKKPVVMFADNLVCREFIADRETGFVSAPGHESLGEVLNAIVSDSALGQAVGNAAEVLVNSAPINGTWQAAIEKLRFV